MMDSFNSKLITSSSFNKYRKSKYKKINSPVLSEILNLENVHFDFHFEPVDRKVAEQVKSQQKKPVCLPILRHLEEVSYDRDDYFRVIIDASLQMENSAMDNSLFLSVSRALLYKIYFFDDKYEFILRKIISQYTQVSDEDFCFSSDTILQQNLRKLLCSYWLSFVCNGAFKSSSKYSEMFSNVLEFIYQIYQISVNNFSNNKLFKKYAVQDLSTILNLKIIVFNGEDGNFYPSKKKFKVCESFESKKLRINDCVFLEKVGELDYQWLMPVTKKGFIDSILEPGEAKFYYFKVCGNYSKQKILLEANLIKKSLGTQLKTSQNYILFQKFLSELAVHSLISLEQIDFDLLLNCTENDEIVHYLNTLWGKKHFNLKKVLKEIEPNRQVESDSVERKKEIKFEYQTETSFCELNKSAEMLNSSSILKFSIENLLNDVSTFKNIESRKSRKKVYEYFQDEEEIELKAMGPLPNNCAKFDVLNDSSDGGQDSVRKEKKEKNNPISEETNLYKSGSKSKSFMLKKRSLDTCLNSLMKLSSSSSFEK